MFEFRIEHEIPFAVGFAAIAQHGFDVDPLASNRDIVLFFRCPDGSP